MSGISKLAADRNKRQLEELAALPGNDSCADCKTKNPRWASHNLGIFICMRCASVHRKLGTHITKVLTHAHRKSLSLDSWTKEQVETMRNIGNVKSNQLWNPDERRHPLPTNMEESERDSEMEKYIRSKYQFGRFKSKSAIVEAHLGPSQSLASLPPRSRTAPVKSETLSASPTSPARATPPPALPREAPSSFSSSFSQQPATMTTPSMNLYSPPSTFSTSSASLGLSPWTNLPPSTNAVFFQPSSSTQQPPPIPPNQQASLTSSTFNDLVSLQTPSSNASLPLQYQPTSTPFTSLSPGPLPSFASDRSPAFRSVSLPVTASPSYAQVPAVTGTGNFGMGGGGGPSQFNPFFPQQQQQQQFGTPMGSPIVGASPSPFNPFSQLTQQQQSPAAQPYGSPIASPIAPQPQQPFANGYQANAFQQQSQFGVGVGSNMSPVGGMQPFHHTPSPSIYQTQPLQQQQQPQMTMSMSPPMQMYQPMGSSPGLSKEAQQAQQLFQNMAAGGSGRNPFGF